MNENDAITLLQTDESQSLQNSSDSEEFKGSSKELLAIMKENSEKLKRF